MCVRSNVISVNVSGVVGKSKLSVCMHVCVCYESHSLGQSESLRAFLNGQQQHMSQLFIAFVGWEVQLVKAESEK